MDPFNPTLSRIASRADYDHLRESFQWHRPEYFNFGLDVVDGWAREEPDRVAIHWVSGRDERTLTFAQLSERTTRLAQALRHSGLKQGDRVLVILPRIVQWWEILVAT